MNRRGLSEIMKILIFLMLGLMGAVVVANMLGFMEVKLTGLVEIFDLGKILETAGIGGES